MIPRINLLPGAYQQARLRHRRFRFTLSVCVCLLAAELAVGLVLHARAADTRELLSATDAATAAIRNVKKTMEEPARRAERLEVQVRLAERLRAKHCWSRLLSTISQAMPERVVLSSIATDPPQWTPALAPVAVSNDSRGRTKSAADNRRLINGIVLQGYAADHGDVAALISAMHASKVFSGVELKQARREKYLNQEAISFELSCRW